MSHRLDFKTFFHAGPAAASPRVYTVSVYSIITYQADKNNASVYGPHFAICRAKKTGASRNISAGINVEKGRFIVTSSERRKDARMEAHLFTVFRRLPKKKKEAGLPQVGYTRDISVGGAYFYTQANVKKGDLLSLAIHVTSDWAEGGSPPKLEGEGKVLRVEGARNARPPDDFRGVAVQFAQEVAVSF